MNTCSFDSLTELIANGYSDYIVYQRQIQADFDDFAFFRLVTDYATYKPSNEWYVERARCLSKALDKPLKNILDCSCNIFTLISKLLQDIPSTINEFNCKKCKTSSKTIKPVLEVNSQPILIEGLKIGLQKSINEYFLTNKKLYCNSCKGYGCESRKPGPHVLIDTEDPFINMLQTDLEYSHASSEIPLSEIPHFIMIKNIKYALIGIVHFIPPEIENGIGHYIAFCKAITGSWKRHDDLKTITEKVPNGSQSRTLVRPAIIAYVKVFN